MDLKTRVACVWVAAAALSIGLGAQDIGQNQPTSDTASNAASDTELPKLRWNESVSGSPNSLTQDMVLDSSVGYNFNQHVAIDVGMPFYAVSQSTTSSTGKKTRSSSESFGNAYATLSLKSSLPFADSTTALTGGAPTGSRTKGFSSGRGTFDLSDRLEHDYSVLQPFLTGGVANTTSDTHYFVHPYTTLGMQAHFEAGSAIKLNDVFSVGASLYDVLPWGTQKMYSRHLARTMAASGGAATHGRLYDISPLIIGTSSIDKDNGGSAWIEATPGSIVDIQLGYSHSVHFDLNSVMFTVGFDMGRLVSR